MSNFEEGIRKLQTMAGTSHEELYAVSDAVLAIASGTNTREIKFRAWDKQEKKMFPVSDISFGDDGRALTVVFQTVPKGKYYRGLVDGENGILMQFTGQLDDQDKEIYEGDIIEIRGTYYDTRRDVVVYDLDLHGFMVDGRFLHDFGKYFDIEVIGNIYENPELVEVPA